MTTKVSCGFPLYVDGMTLTAELWRQYDVGTAVIDAGSTSALTPAGGVFPEGTAIGGVLKVTAGTGMAVNVSAGYCCVPSSTAQNGGYIFGLMDSGSLTVAANSTGSTRNDLVVANVQDVASPSSYCQVEYLTATSTAPTNSIPLAAVAVPNGASSIVSGDITDQRAFVVAPGCVLPVNAAANAPAAPGSQFMYDMGTAQLVQGTSTAGKVNVYTPPAGQVYFTTATSGFGWTSYGYGWPVVMAQLIVSADGLTDYEISYSVPLVENNLYYAPQVTLTIDDNQVDGVYVSTAPYTYNTGGGVSATYFTSSGAGTRMGKGTHTVAVNLISRGYYATATGTVILRAAPVTL